MSGTMSGPHPWTQAGPFWRRYCQHCYLTRSRHPTGWTTARPLGDRRRSVKLW